jgi:hypothetical protein
MELLLLLLLLLGWRVLLFTSGTVLQNCATAHLRARVPSLKPSSISLSAARMRSGAADACA